MSETKFVENFLKIFKSKMIDCTSQIYLQRRRLSQVLLKGIEDEQLQCTFLSVTLSKELKKLEMKKSINMNKKKSNDGKTELQLQFGVLELHDQIDRNGNKRKSY